MIAQALSLPSAALLDDCHRGFKGVNDRHGHDAGDTVDVAGMQEPGADEGVEALLARAAGCLKAALCRICMLRTKKCISVRVAMALKLPLFKLRRGNPVAAFPGAVRCVLTTT